MKIRTVFGGKDPHPNWLVGGVPVRDQRRRRRRGRRDQHGAPQLRLLDHRPDDRRSSRTSTSPTSWPSASFYKGWLYGGGLSGKSVLAYGDIPENANDYSPANLLMPSGAIINGNLKEVHPGRSARSRRRSRSSCRTPGTSTRTRRRACIPGTASPSRTTCSGPMPRAPRPTSRRSTRAPSTPGSRRRAGRGTPWRSGPLARYVVGYAKGDKEITEQINLVLKTLDVPVDALFSTLGRTAARALECAVVRPTSSATSWTS